MKSLQMIFGSFAGCNLLIATTAYILPTSNTGTLSNLFFEVLWIIIGAIFAGLLTRILRKWIMMIPVLCLVIIGGSVFIPIDVSHITQMLQGLSSGVVYTANLILIKRYVDGQMRRNAIALSCAFRLISGVAMPKIIESQVDAQLQGGILIGLAVLSGVLIVFSSMKMGKDRVWDEYYESYFERQSKLVVENESLFYRFRYFLIILGMRMPGMVLNNNVTKAIQHGFLETFSPTVAKFYFIVFLACALLLFMTAFHHPSHRNPSSVKYLIIPPSYIAMVMVVANIPLIYMYSLNHGGLSLMAILILNFLLNFAFYGRVFYLLDTILVQSNLSNLKISLIVVLEIVIVTLCERILLHGSILHDLTLMGYYSILSGCSIVAIFLYHKELGN